MDKQYLFELLKKYNNGEATQEEKEFLVSYFHLFENVSPEKDWSAEEIKNLKSDIKNSIWQSIENASHQKSVTPLLSFNSWWIKAVAAAFIIIGSLLVLLPDNNGKPPIASTTFKIITGEKENRLIHLPDGSSVLVNKGSTFRYPSSFANTKDRTVYLEGEAYFNIHRDPSKPFIVHSRSLKTTVLGTAFNIKALQHEKDITVTVTRGKVQIADTARTLGLLTKGQQIIYNTRLKNAIKTDVSAPDLEWKKQDLLMDDVTVADAAALLKDWFNVNIQIDRRVDKESRFTTVFSKEEKISDVLESICVFNGLAYSYKSKNEILIYPAGSPPNH